MTSSERRAWETRREQYESRVIESAQRRGKLPVIDCTDPKYPVPPHVLAELRRANDPDARERAYREANALRKKAASLRSLALLLERDAADGTLTLTKAERKKKLDSGEAMRAKASEHDARAAEVESAVAP